PNPRFDSGFAPALHAACAVRERNLPIAAMQTRKAANARQAPIRGGSHPRCTHVQATMDVYPRSSRVRPWLACVAIAVSVDSADAAPPEPTAPRPGVPQPEAPPPA